MWVAVARMGVCAMDVFCVTEDDCAVGIRGEAGHEAVLVGSKSGKGVEGSRGSSMMM